MNQLRANLMLVLMLGVVGSPQAWGPVGHETVSYIAEDYLSSAAKEKISHILGPNMELADVSNWADSIRMYRPNTASWHFIDLKVRQTLTEDRESQFCSGGDCVVDQINKDIAVLKAPTEAAEQKREALKFLIHFVGDIHQPLHCADDEDRGGNEKIVRYFNPENRSGSRKGRKIKLHAFWDHLLEVHNDENPRALATLLEELLLLPKGKNGVPEMLLIGHGKVMVSQRRKYFSEFSAGPTSDPDGIPLPEDYYTDKMRNIVNLQLEKAGVRLALSLEGVFSDSGSSP